jgi:putative ABC transport system substrate-binding protein
VNRFWIFDFGFPIGRSSRKNLFFAVLTTAFLTATYSSEAQQPKKIPNVAVLRPGSPPDSLVDSFINGLRGLGYLPGQNISMSYYWARGKPERVREVAAELVRLKPDVIFAPDPAAVEATKELTSTIPIVFAAAGDPVGSGFVASLARPGGNITGLTSIFAELSMKRLELLKETVPKTTRVAVLANPELPFH